MNLNIFQISLSIQSIANPPSDKDPFSEIPRASCIRHPFSLSGSITVESSLLMPSVFLILLLMLFLLAHAHNRSVLLSSSCESAVSGKEQHPAVLYLETASGQEMQTTPAARTVTYTLTSSPFLRQEIWTKQSKAVYDIVDPSSVLHHLFALQAVSDS